MKGVPGCPDLVFRDLRLAYACHEHVARDIEVIGWPPPVKWFDASDTASAHHIERVVVCNMMLWKGDDYIQCRAWRRLQGKVWHDPGPRTSLP